MYSVDHLLLISLEVLVEDFPLVRKNSFAISNLCKTTKADGDESGQNVIVVDIEKRDGRSF